MIARRATALLSAVFLVAAGLVTAPAAQAARPGTVVGTVTGDSRPLAGVVVSAVLPNGSPDFQFTVAQGVTAADGTYRLVVGDEDVRVFFDASAVVGGTSPTGFSSTCRGGTGGCWLGGTVLHLQSGPPVRADIALPRAAEIRGRLTDTAGRSIANEPVLVYDGSTGETMGAVVYRSTTSDLNGNYRLTGLTPFTYRLTFGNARQQATGPDPDGYVVTSPSGGGTVRAGQIKTVDAALVGNGGFRGRVVDQAGRPVAGAFVQTDVDIQDQFGPPLYLYAETAADGTYRVGALAPGSHRFCASKDGYTANCDDPTAFPYRVTIRDDPTTRVATVVIRLSS